MKKELSQSTLDAFRRNNRSPEEVDDGEEFLSFLGDALVSGSMVHCDTQGCPKFGYVNGGTVDAQTTPESALVNIPVIKSPNFVGEAIGCYDEDGSGDVLCPACIEVRKAKGALS